MMPDYRIRALLVDKNVEIVAAVTTALAQEAELRHLAGRVAAVALAKTMTAAVLVGSRLKGSERLSIQFNMDGGIRGILVDVDADGNTRGMTQRKVVGAVDAGPSHYSYGLGNRGTVTLLQSTAFKETARGTAEMTTFDVAGDIEHCLRTSQQIPSALALAAEYDADIGYAGGVLAQALAGHDATAFGEIERRFAAGDVMDALRRRSAPESLVDAIAVGAAVRIEDRSELRFRCRCSHEKVVDMMRTLPVDELEELATNEEPASVTCNFCNVTYEIDSAALRRLLGER